MDERRVTGGIVVCSSKSTDRAGFNGERLHGGNDVRLQLDDFWRRSCANSGDPERSSGSVVEFERFQLHSVHVGADKHLLHNDIDLIEVLGTDETLN
ncbi:hypothetical protein D9M71_649410 [compost metagenome]